MLRSLIFVSALSLASGLSACASPGPDESGSGAGFDLCAYIDANTPSEVPATDAVTVYCQTSTDCTASEQRVTTEAVLTAAQTECEASDELASWDRLPGECDAGAADAVRCWRLD